MINGQDRRRTGRLPGQRGGRCHRRPDRFQRPFESTSRPHPALDEIASCCGSAAYPQAFEWPIRSSIPEHSPRLAGPPMPRRNCPWFVHEGREPKDHRRYWCPTVVSDRAHRGTCRRRVLHNPPWCSPGGTAPARSTNCPGGDHLDTSKTNPGCVHPRSGRWFNTLTSSRP